MSTSHKRIAVGMSGGLDSSVAAAMLVDQGHDVVGLTAHMWKDGSRCCSVEDVERARKMCWTLGIEHFVLNGSEPFREHVVDPFINAYLDGMTPSPCVLCNEKVKFGFLLTRAVQFDCDALATGHYARIEQHSDRHSLLRARDGAKDQTYFLHRLSQRKLAHVVFPLGELSKDEDVRPYAVKRELHLEGGRESQDLCFVPPNEYASFVEKESTGRTRPGTMVDCNGREVGVHSGIHNYTIGQRRGLGIASTEPMYVTSIDPDRNEIVVGPREQVMRSSCSVCDLSWISGLPPGDGTYDVRIRYQHEPARAAVKVTREGVEIEFEQPQFAITPGQAAVIYDGDEVLGGGWIQRSHEQ